MKNKGIFFLLFAFFVLVSFVSADDLMDDDAVLGHETAPVVMVEFGGYEETFSRKFWTETFPKIKSDYIDAGKVKFVFRDFPLEELFPNDGIAAMAAECVHLQYGNEAYFEMWNALYSTSPPLDEETLKNAAGRLGYDINDCLNNLDTLQEVVLDYIDATNLGIGGSPTFFINDQIISGAYPFSNFQAVIEQELDDNTECFLDSNCDDNNVETMDICNNPGTTESYCDHGFEEEYTLLIHSPQDKTYDVRKIKFNISISEIAEELTYVDMEALRPIERTLCKNCNNYGLYRDMFKSFSEGRHKINVMAKNEEGDTSFGEDVIYFTIDTKSPRILRVWPKGGFSNGTFNLEFKEAQPTSIRFFYGDSGNNLNYTFFNISNVCGQDRIFYQCPISTNLNQYSDFENEEISYGFEILDYFNRSTISRIYQVIVDTTSPVLNDFNYEINGRRINFFFDVEETNFDRIIYIDGSESNTREKVLCSRLVDGVCGKTKSFALGSHSLKIKVLDKAGNFIERDISFEIV